MLDIDQLNHSLETQGTLERLRWVCDTIGRNLVFTTSFGLEDQYITRLIGDNRLPIDIVTLDTGRLFPETYDLWSQTEETYDLKIKAVYPDQSALEKLIRQHGINGMYKSHEARLSCCDTRKVAPLRRALSDADGWITGLRREQSSFRHDMRFASYDEDHKVIKINPLADCTRDNLVSAIRAFNIPYNALHDGGYTSIGCQPCTRAIRVGESEREGRWWWERDGQSECGLHLEKKVAT